MMLLTESLIFLVEFINFLLNMIILAILFKKFLIEDRAYQTKASDSSTTTTSETVYEKKTKK
jgi:hypothetical protein